MPLGPAVEPAHALLWSPQPGPQTHLISCPVFEVFFGGARGGGKTEASIGDWLQHSHEWGERAVGLFVRKTAKQLEEVIARTKQIFPHIGAKFNESRSEWKMPGGGRLKFRYLEKDSDAEEYQGHSYTRVYVEEATNFESPEPINKLRATLRSAHGAPCGMRLTGNPGGPGHSWVKERYILPNPRGYELLREEFTNPFDGTTSVLERVFIPSRISDNRRLLETDPLYVARIQQQGSGALVKAWLMGDWDVVIGSFFDNFDPRAHILSAAEWAGRIPKHSARFRAFDWGSSKPFSAGWYVVSDGTWGLPRGALLKYREWYGMEEGKPNVGLRLTSEQVARGIIARSENEAFEYDVADPAIFARDGGPSISESMMIEGITWRRGDNSRVPGWTQLRQYLGNVMTEGASEPTPIMLYFLDTCVHTIRTLPILQAAENKPEDLDTKQEDHAADETRYACMSRPQVQDAPKAVEDVLDTLRNYKAPTINELLARNTARRLNRESMRV